MSVEKWRVSDEESGVRLPEVLCRQTALNLTSCKQARRLIEAGRCSVNGRIRKFASVVVAKGDWIEVVPGEIKKRRPECVIIYEDEWLFVVNKPPGITVEKESLERAVKKECILVHRIDKDTSGLLIVAKDHHMASFLELLFRERSLKKEYLAIVDGEVEKKHGNVQWSLRLKGRSQGGVYWGVTTDHSGKSAYTEFTRVIAKNNASLVHLVPMTGRTHQLRVHMAHLGHPVLGDYQYADQFRCAIRPSRHLLHAWKLSMPHPELGREMSWTAPIPEDMQQVAQVLFGADVVRKLCALC
jgi:RluA family pseudouridine synthase